MGAIVGLKVGASVIAGGVLLLEEARDFLVTLTYIITANIIAMFTTEQTCIHLSLAILVEEKIRYQVR